MDFGKKLMQKYGWKEGNGLGKNNDGINKAIKANFKFDTAGLGVDKAADFNNHWWERVFNEAANNIDVKTDGQKVSMEVKDDNSVEISTKEYSINKLQKAKGSSDTYNNFLKTSILTNLGNEESNPERINVDDIQVTQIKTLTDDELFAACGGRTAHKGARHGLQLTGKLSRIEEQEKFLLEQMIKNKNNENNWSIVKSKKKKKKEKLLNENEMENSINEITFTAEYSNNSRKRSRKQKKINKDLSNCIESISMEDRNDKEESLGLSNQSKAIKKDKKKKKKKEIIEEKIEIDWKNYRNPNTLELDGNVKEIFIDELEKNTINDINELTNDDTKNLTNCKKRKKKNSNKEKLNSISGVNKKAERKKNNEFKKSAKKLKKNLENITKNLENVMEI